MWGVWQYFLQGPAKVIPKPVLEQAFHFLEMPVELEFLCV